VSQSPRRENKLTVGSLFAGIGGFDLGFERAGFEIKWQVEIDSFCRQVLEKHWPNVRRYGDVRTLDRFAGLPEQVDVICGGFPCQDISFAGPGAGLAGTRSGLWSEYLRIIRELRPEYVVVENVAALLARGMGTVLGDLAASGYDAEWDCIPASSLGAHHRRDRVWIVAYPNSERELQPQGVQRDEWRRAGDSSAAVAYANGSRLPEPRHAGTLGSGPARIFAGATLNRGSWWAVEPAVGRMAHGIPERVDRLKGLGNAIVPQIAQWIAERIKEAEAQRTGVSLT
jgi:DNA (cytosine-5)-methyltransferase 1